MVNKIHLSEGAFLIAVAGHEDERMSFKNYCFDQLTNSEIESQLENASNMKTALKGKQSVGLKVSTGVNKPKKKP